ncbi:MAG: GNAT family N-acetyltransferase [Candidatus Zipacnadales bacterium]
MVAPTNIRAYRPSDETALLSTWNATFPYDPLDVATFRRKVLLDSNFDPAWLLVAEAQEELAGLCLCLIRRVPLEHGGLEPERGWITAFGVRMEHRQRGLGSALLGRALELFRDAGREEVLISPYTPNYFVPGVDVQHYAEGLAFLLSRGFEIVSRPLSMDANIVLLDHGVWQEREKALLARGIEIRSLRGQEIPLLLSFLKAHASPDWIREARLLLTDVTRGLASVEQFAVAVVKGEIVGYCQFRGEHLGPFGVREDLRGKGIGTVLLAHCLQTMRAQGLHHAWVLWTSDEVAERVYSKFGFRETRRFAVLRHRLR